MSRDAFALKMQREVCHPKCARKVSGLSRNGHLKVSDLSHYYLDGSHYCKDHTLKNSFQYAVQIHEFHVLTVLCMDMYH